MYTLKVEASPQFVMTSGSCNLYNEVENQIYAAKNCCIMTKANQYCNFKQA